MGLSFLRGLVAAVNPCGFILLPTYLMYFLGMQGQAPGSQRATIRRALLVSGSLSAGFMSVFVVAGPFSAGVSVSIEGRAIRPVVRCADGSVLVRLEGVCRRPTAIEVSGRQAPSPAR